MSSMAGANRLSALASRQTRVAHAASALGLLRPLLGRAQIISRLLGACRRALRRCLGVVGGALRAIGCLLCLLRRAARLIGSASGGLRLGKRMIGRRPRVHGLHSRRVGGSLRRSNVIFRRAAARKHCRADHQRQKTPTQNQMHILLPFGNSATVTPVRIKSCAARGSHKIDTARERKILLICRYTPAQELVGPETRLLTRSSCFLPHLIRAPSNAIASSARARLLALSS